MRIKRDGFSSACIRAKLANSYAQQLSPRAHATASSKPQLLQASYPRNRSALPAPRSCTADPICCLLLAAVTLCPCIDLHLS
ncbi:hypothetical protein V6N13_137461 [Hibiscus sabdariffa]